MKMSLYIKENLNIPNILSLFRIALIIPFITSVIKDDYVTAGIILILSGVSDMLDGIIARKFEMITELGKMLDPTADKLTLMAVMICVGIKFPDIFPFMIILIIKEISMLAAGALLLKHSIIPPAAKWYGKAATAVFYVSVVTIIAMKAIFNITDDVLNFSLMSATAVCMLYAVLRYLKIFIVMIKNDKNNK